MGLRDDILSIPFDSRFHYDEALNTLFLDFENLRVKSLELMEKCVDRIRAICEPLGQKVQVIVNYDGFEIDPELESAYVQYVKEMEDRYYDHVTRFTTNAFVRAKLGETLQRGGIEPNLFDSNEGAAMGDSGPAELAKPDGPS